MGLTIEKQIGGRLIKKAIKKRVTKSITDKIIKKFAGEHGKAAAIRKFGKERVAKVKISTKKIGTPPSGRGYGGGQGDIIPSKPMTGKPHLLQKINILLIFQESLLMYQRDKEVCVKKVVKLLLIE